MSYEVSRHGFTSISALAAVVILIGGLIWLAGSQITPPIQKIEQTVSDDRIPR